MIKEFKWLTVMYSDGNVSFHKDREGGYYKSLSFEDLQVGVTANCDMEYFTPVGRYAVDMWEPYRTEDEEGVKTPLYDLDTGEVVDTLYQPAGENLYSESGVIWACEGEYYYPV